MDPPTRPFSGRSVSAFWFTLVALILYSPFAVVAYRACVRKRYRRMLALQVTGVAPLAVWFPIAARFFA
jgi:hypothetical protein